MNKNIKEKAPTREIEFNKENPRSDSSDSEKEKSKRKKEKDEKAKKPRVPIVRLKPHHLIDPQKGLRKLYDATKNNNAVERDDMDQAKKLDFLLRTVKEWHFQLMPKYTLEYFLFKTQQYGKLPAIKTYMSQLRKVHAGDNTWEDFEEEKEYPEEPPEDKPRTFNKSDGFWSLKYMAQFKGDQSGATTSQAMASNPSAKKPDQMFIQSSNQRDSVSQNPITQANNITPGTHPGAPLSNPSTKTSAQQQQQEQGKKNITTSTSSSRQQKQISRAAYDDYDDEHIDADYDRILDEIAADLPIPDENYEDNLQRDLFAEEENRLDEEDLVRKIKKVRLNPPNEK